MYHSNNQRKIQPPTLTTPNETEARAKLANYVYEYLCQNGAPKAAEAFKSEVQTLADSQQINLSGDGPGFLHNWWSVFWDLYSATPDRQEKGTSTLEAKAFVDMFHGYGSSLNGGQFPSVPPGMSVPPHAGMDPSMMGNFYRPPQPNVGPSSQSSPIPGYQNTFNGPPRFSHHMGPRPGMPPQMGPNSFMNASGYPPNDPRMMIPNRMGPNPRSLSFPTNMRQVRPGMYGPSFDSPTTPTFPQQAGLMPNGVPMNGPMPSMMPGMPPNSYDPQMMMHPNMNPQFSMMCDPSGSGTPISSAGPTSCAPHSVPTNIGGPSSVGSGHGNMPASASADNPQLAGSSSLSNLLNGGGDINKQSPSSVQGVVSMNGGTPAQQHGPGSQNNGPGSATGLAGGPGSVHSQGGNAPNSVNANNPQLQSTPQSHAAQLTPTSGADNALLDYQQNNDNPNEENDDGNKEEEISKIKRSLIEGFGSVFS